VEMRFPKQKISSSFIDLTAHWTSWGIHDLLDWNQAESISQSTEAKEISAEHLIRETDGRVQVSVGIRGPLRMSW
jgi:hypothetical protein